MSRNHLRGSIIPFFVQAILATCLMVSGAIAQTGPTIAGCSVFPANNVWNTPIDHLPVDSNSGAYINTIGATKGVHPDFGSGLWNGGPIGIPFNVVPGTQPKVNITFDYADESDPGPYPIPPNALIEGGSQSTGDRHVLVLDRDNCLLYEVFYGWPQPDGTWNAGSGAKFDLRSNGLRPNTWTSADAAGLPILPGLLRYDEVASGEVRHAIRFTAPQTRKAYVWPARHYASSLTASNYPPLGQRFRLKADFDISGFSNDVQVILRALKKYGMILADNGSSWFISGAPDERWNNDALVNELKLVTGSNFDAVDESSLMVNPDSGQAAFSDSVEFVKQQYRDFLNREADAGGLQFWVNQIDTGAMTRAQVISAFLHSQEFEGRIAPIVRLYFAFFLRIPDYGGLQYWINQYANGMPLASVSEAFVASQEFKQRYGSLSNEQFVTLVYQNVLGRSPDSGGYAYWVGQLNSETLTRGQAMLGFSESPEYKGLIGNEVHVTMTYVGMLRRSPEQQGFDFWVGFLDSGNSELSLIDGFLNSDEYANRS